MEQTCDEELAALKHTNELRAIPVSLLTYGKKGCNARRYANTERNFCAFCDETCTWSFAKTDPAGWRSADGACRCNSKEFWFVEPPIATDECCQDAGTCCPDMNDGYGPGVCHVSYPWWNSRDDTTGEANRCKYPFEPIQYEIV